MNKIIASILTIFIFYLIELLLTYVLWPSPPKLLNVDGPNANKESLYGRGVRQLIFDSKSLENDNKKIILIGQSGIQYGLKPNELKGFFPEYEIHSVAYGGMNIIEMKQVVDLIVSKVPENAYKNLTLILGIHYETFNLKDPINSNTDNVQTLLEREYNRYFIYNNSIKNSIPTSYFSDEFTNFLLILLRPFELSARFKVEERLKIFINKFTNNNNNNSYFESFHNIFTQNENIQNNHTLNFEEANYWINKASEKLGPISEWDNDRFNLLKNVVSAAKIHNINIIVLDLPLPFIYTNQLAYDTIYQKNLINLIESNNFNYFNLRNLYSESEYFFDFVHLKPKYSYLLAFSLKYMLEDNLRKFELQN